MRTRVAVLAVSALVIAAFAPAQAGHAQRRDDGSTKTERAALRMGTQVPPKSTRPGARPEGVNPYLAFVPDPSVIDYAGWNRFLEAKGQVREAKRLQAPGKAGLAPPIVVDEDEPAGTFGSNDSTATAQPVPGFGTGAGKNPRARILGTLSPEEPLARRIPPNPEDDGSIPLAGDTGIGSTTQAVSTSAVVGDGPHGDAGDGTGDFDVYALEAVPGERITVDTDTPTGPLDTMVLLFDSTGEEVAFNDDDGESFDSRLRYDVTAADTYYAFIVGFFSIPEDPFDSGSGTGADSEGPYDVTISAGEPDLDYYAVRLRKGDVLGASLEGAGDLLTIYDPHGENVHGSDHDATYILPAASPLPGGGNAVTEHVADETGWHFVSVDGDDGEYDVTVEAYRPPLETDTPSQTLFLDFDGARVNTGIFGGPGVRTLSPLRAFLGRWGLTNADLDPLITAIVAEVRENIRADMIAHGLNPNFKIRILNSRDDADPFGKPNVSRVIVGGTIDQSGVDTIGIAQSIDPGNFEAEETALVLLDLLSDPPAPEYSLNTYLEPSSDKIGFIAQALGNVTSHEAGHFFGNFHVDQFNDQANLMDAGGANFDVLFGVGPDGIGGTADDTDVDFGEDVFNPDEGFTGIEDTLTRLEFGLTS